MRVWALSTTRRRRRSFAELAVQDRQARPMTHSSSSGTVQQLGQLDEYLDIEGGVGPLAAPLD